MFLIGDYVQYPSSTLMLYKKKASWYIVRVFYGTKTNACFVLIHHVYIKLCEYCIPLTITTLKYNNIIFNAFTD